MTAFRRMRFGWLALPAVMALALFAWRGVRHYAPPDCGGAEPAANHEAAELILQTGGAAGLDYPPGYAYVTALAYIVAPDDPRSVIVLQVLGLLVVLIAMARTLHDEDAGVGALLLVAYLPLAYFAVVYNGAFAGFLLATAALLMSFSLVRQTMLKGLLAHAAALGGVSGVLVCIRPDYVLWLACAPAIVWITRGWRRAAAVGFVVATVAAVPVVAMYAASPPPSGSAMRGEHVAARSMLLGTYQYENRWWDWDFVLESSEPESVRAMEATHAIERDVGEPYGSKAVTAAMRAAAVERMKEHPALFLKKLVVGAVRFWVFIPTQFGQGTKAYACALLEMALALLATRGLALLWRRDRPRFVLFSVALFAATATHMLIYVEARHSLPGRAPELLAACVGAADLLRRMTPRVGQLIDAWMLAGRTV